VRRIPAAVALAAVVTVATVLTGCATVPPPTGAGWIAALPAGCTAYFFADLKEENRGAARAILDAATEPGLVSDRVMENTDRIYGAVKTIQGNAAPAHAAAPTGAPPDFYAVVEGSFPGVPIRYFLSRMDGWTMAERPRLHWIGPDGTPQLCFPSGQAALLTSGDIRPMIERYDALTGRAGGPETTASSSRARVDWTRRPVIPEVVIEAMAHDELVAYFPDLGGALATGAVRASLPVDRSWIRAQSAAGTAGGYTLSGVFELADQRAASGFSGLLRLMLVYILREAEVDGFLGRLKGLELTRRGTTVGVRGLELSAEELARVVGVLLGREAAR